MKTMDSRHVPLLIWRVLIINVINNTFIAANFSTTKKSSLGLIDEELDCFLKIYFLKVLSVTEQMFFVNFYQVLVNETIWRKVDSTISQEGKQSHGPWHRKNYIENVARLLKHMSISKIEFERNDLSIYRNNI